MEGEFVGVIFGFGRMAGGVFVWEFTLEFWLVQVESLSLIMWLRALFFMGVLGDGVGVLLLGDRGGVLEVVTSGGKKIRCCGMPMREMMVFVLWSAVVFSFVVTLKNLANADQFLLSVCASSVEMLWQWAQLQLRRAAK